MTGHPPPTYWTAGGHVTVSPDGSLTAVLEYLPHQLRFGPWAPVAVAHEYVHVLQHQLSGVAPACCPGAEPTDRIRLSSYSPAWMAEGFAVYGDYLYSTAVGADPFIPVQVDPYKEMRCNRATLDMGVELQRLERYCPNYELAFGAAILLVGDDQQPQPIPSLNGIAEDRHTGLEYWQLLSEEEQYWYRAESESWQFETNWEAAFEKAFGLTIDDFYSQFSEWAASDMIADRSAQIEKYMLDNYGMWWGCITRTPPPQRE